ncbi:MFS transporter [Eisenbergiella massiliensis]|uniref:MFS transporter n=1 Tax=Eisenbergiella massiliensis TaxID=1720294 RepID=A0A3E3I4Q5_9FIRM|nr:MFS transporter [Eisenbergiella massiliensis]RGE60254.1 MFS transporter [Eisenbergiella massiliensis]
MNQNNYEDREPLWTKSYILLILMGMITSTCFYMINPTITKYAIEIGASVAIAGIIAGMFSVTALITRPFSGFLADRLNRRNLLLTATIFMGIAAIGYSFSKTVPLLVFFRILHGIAFSFSGTVNISSISLFVPHKRLGEGVGYYGLVYIIATAVGPSLGLYLGDTLGYSSSYLLSGIVLLLVSTFVFVIGFPKNEKKEIDKIKFNVNNLFSIQVLPLAVFGGLFSMSNGIISGYIALLGDIRGIENVGIYFTINAFVLFITRPFVGKIADKSKGIYIVIPAMIMDGLALFILGRASGLTMIVIASVFKALGQGSGQLTIQAEALKKLPPERSGIASSTYYVGADVGQGLGPMIAGGIVGAVGNNSLGYQAMFSVVSCVFIMGILLFIIYIFLGKRKKMASIINLNKV